MAGAGPAWAPLSPGLGGGDSFLQGLSFQGPREPLSDAKHLRLWVGAGGGSLWIIAWISLGPPRRHGNRVCVAVWMVREAL